MNISPDNRHIVYDRPVKEHESLRDIFLLTTDGSGEETRLTEHPANDYGPVWSPDGKSIVFVSNRTPDGTVGLWLMQIVDGKPSGKPQLVKKEVGDIRTLGFTDKGSLFYATETSWWDIYIASVDMETGELTSKPELLPSRGINTVPTWSPDGESLAYESRRTATGSFRVRPVLVIRSMKTGEEREIIPDRDIATWGTSGDLRWSPDGRSILWLPTYDLHLIDVQTGHITANVVTGKGEAIMGPTWSHDGKTIFYTRMRYEKEDWPCRIVALDLETRAERELYASGRRGGPLAVSPDGRQLAFSGKGSLMVIPTAGGKPRTLLRKDPNLESTDFFGAPVAWTPDGRYVLYHVIKKSPSHGITQLWRVSAEGGVPQEILEMEGVAYLTLCSVSLHPDGRRIAFQKGRNRQVDLWVMENLLPTFTASR
jgi:Tol biopolymer transport system component